MSFPMCSTCSYGVVQERKISIGTQDPKKIVYCTLMRMEVPPDLSFCSKHSVPGKHIDYWDMHPAPQILHTNNTAKKAVADMLLVLLQARMRS